MHSFFLLASLAASLFCFLEQADVKVMAKTMKNAKIKNFAIIGTAFVIF